MNSVKQRSAELALALGTVGAALTLKLAYSRAGADDLHWVLAPSCWLARLSGVALTHESAAGFISHAQRLVVGPACAGVNFLVTAWIALYLCVQGSLLQSRRKLQWSALSFAAAYAATVVVNGLRISLAARLYQLQGYGALLSKSRAHALLGVVLYCGALLVLCQLASAWVAKSAQLTAAKLAHRVYAIYLGVVLGLPLLDGAWLRDPQRFAEHALLTAGTGALVLFIFTQLACSNGGSRA
jgi:exosortase K